MLSLGTASPHAFVGSGPSSGASPVVSISTMAVPAPSTLSYDLVQADGQVASVGGAGYYGSAYGIRLVQPVVDLVPTSDRKGYWLIGADASVFPYGDAKYEGDAGGAVRAWPVVSAAATPDDLGYWLLTALGHVLAFGDAKSYGQVTLTTKARAVAIVPTADGKGYWIATSTGGVYPFGDAQAFVAAGVPPKGQRIVAMAVSSDYGGYWLAAADGEVFSYGDAPQLGAGRPAKLASPVVGLSVNPSDTGAWLAEQNGTVVDLGSAIAHGSLKGVTTPVTAIAAMVLPPPNELSYDLAEADGRVAALGRAGYYGSAYGKHLIAPVIALVPTPDRKGYWLVGADGSVYAFGDAHNEGGAGGRVRQDPIVAAASTPDGRGYWLVTGAGRVLFFGDAGDFGSVKQPFAGHVVGIVGTPDGQGYWIACRSGQVLRFGDASFYGSAGATSPRQAIVAIASTPDGGGYWLGRANGNVAALWRCPPPGRSGTGEDDLAGCRDGGHPRRDRLVGRRAERHGRDPRQGHLPWLARPRAGDRPGHLDRGHDRVRRLTLQYPSGSFGYDINWPQCKGSKSSDTIPLPGAPTYPAGTGSYTIAVVGVDGWAIGSPNPCLRAEIAWARGQRAPTGHRMTSTCSSTPPQDLTRSTNRPGGDMRGVLRHQTGDVSCLQLRLQLGADRHELRRLGRCLVSYVVARHRKRHLWPVLVVQPDEQRTHDPGRDRLPAMDKR